MTYYFATQGIVHETSCVGTPQQNNRVKRKHCHIFNIAWALPFQAHIPIEFWGYCTLAAGYLINMTPTKILNGKTPFKLIYGRPPPLNHLRVFGCLCYVHNQKHGGDRFANRGTRYVFVGYPFNKKGWKVYNLETGVVTVSRDVIFNEIEFPFQELSSASSSSSPATSLSPPDLFFFYDEELLTEQELSQTATPEISPDPINDENFPTPTSSPNVRITKITN